MLVPHFIYAPLGRASSYLWSLPNGERSGLPAPPLGTHTLRGLDWHAFRHLPWLSYCSVNTGKGRGGLWVAENGELSAVCEGPGLPETWARKEEREAQILFWLGETVCVCVCVCVHACTHAHSRLGERENVCVCVCVCVCVRARACTHAHSRTNTGCGTGWPLDFQSS